MPTTSPSPATTALRLLLGAALAASLLVLAPSTPAHAGEGDGYASWGRTKAPDQWFRKGCHHYRYRYRIDPPTQEWYLETILRGPGGRKLAADLFHFNDDPKRDKATFEVCGAATRPGRFTIRAKVVYRDGFDEHTGRLRPSHFRVTRR